MCLIRKIHKVKYERDTQCPDKLLPAVFAANKHFIRSISYPFELMFGRECDSFRLVKLTISTSVDTNIEASHSIKAVVIPWIFKQKKQSKNTTVHIG